MTKIYRITLPYNNINYLMLNWANVYKYVHVLPRLGGQNQVWGFNQQF